MGLTSQINEAVLKAFLAMGDLVHTGTVVEKPDSDAYDPTSDTYDNNDEIPHVVDQAVIVGFKEEEKDNSDIRETDSKCLIPNEFLNGYKPVTNDDYVDYNSIRYSIESAKVDPSGSLWTLRIRTVE